MSEEEESGDYTVEEPEVISGHKKCQTSDVKFLLLGNLYEKLLRPNIYDVGGSYEQKKPHYWFIFQTEHTSNHFVIHIFACSWLGTSFSLKISSSSQMTVDRKNKNVYLSKFLEEFHIPKTEPLRYSYITSYNFSEIDAEELKDKKVYIPLNISSNNEDKPASYSNGVITEISTNQDFGSLLTDPIGSDYVIESTEGVKFQVHKVILAAHSKVFETMFKEDNKLLYSEGDSMKPDVKAEELQCFLEFLYTGSVKDVHNCNVLSLLLLADKYEVQGLQDLCEHVLLKQLGPDNALNILMWSDLLNSEVLKTASLRTIKKYPSIIKSSLFKQMKNVDLIQEICRYVVDNN